MQEENNKSQQIHSCVSFGFDFPYYLIFGRENGLWCVLF